MERVLFTLIMVHGGRRFDILNGWAAHFYFGESESEIIMGHITKNHIVIALIVCVTTLASIYMFIGYCREAKQIDAKRTIEQTEIEQKAETERTEERSQFWQKLIPWGKDGTEVSQ